jgi:hypothetical protein
VARHSVWDEKRDGREVQPPTLPVFQLADIDIEFEAKDAAARVAERKLVRRARDAWDAIHKSESVEGWAAIGGGLAIGKRHALKVTGANAAWGRNYSREFGIWMKAHGFGSMRPSDRSYAIELHENYAVITAWRATLPDKQRRRLRGAQQNVKRWRRESEQPARRDDVARALAAWRHFCTCMQMLTRSQAGEIWRAVSAEAAARI